MKRIPLTKGLETIVDDDIFEWASKFSWYAEVRKSGVAYAVRRGGIRLHRQILGARSGEQVDHKDGNGLNNVRSNLRLATNQTNQWAHQTKRTKTSSPFRGVSKSGSGWRARITKFGKNLELGTFLTEQEAALAYDAKAKEIFGEFATPNFYES
jgi:hypothetical protein